MSTSDFSKLDGIRGEVRVTAHRQNDDLLSAGLGLAGLRAAPAPFADPAHPTAAELRRRAIQSSWKGLADLGPLGGYGEAYGAVPDVPGVEYQAFAWLPGAKQPHRVLLQLPDHFDTARRCLVVTASSGSRGVYGAISLAGAWGLPRGCAVVYTDKGAGTGYVDPSNRSGVALDGTRAALDSGAALEFVPPLTADASAIAIKHLHSGDNPEADWGRHVLQAAKFGLAMLDRAYPEQAPFTPSNTRIIATGLSNGGGAVLQAAGIDDEHLLAGVIALEPNILAPQQGRALYDYATEASLWLPCALSGERFAHVPFARTPKGEVPPTWAARCTALRVSPEQAYQHLHAAGWRDGSMEVAASVTAFDLWRAITAGYASAYLRTGADAMPCGFRYVTVDADGKAAPASEAARAAWWADGAGIPPGNGIGLVGGTTTSADPNLVGAQCLRALWDGRDAQALALHAAVAAATARLPRADLPLWIVHGADDGLLPTVFTSEPYVAWLRSQGRQPLFWKVPHAQHFDAFLPLPGFGERHLPLLPYGYAALDKLYAHLFDQAAWPSQIAPLQAAPRGSQVLTRAALGLP